MPTLRYYEEIGLIEPPSRSKGNQRRYERSTLDRVRFIRNSRNLGLSIESIRGLIELGKNPDMPCENAHLIAREHLGHIQQKIVQLRKLQAELVGICAMCETGTISNCKVLEAFSREEIPSIK